MRNISNLVQIEQDSIMPLRLQPFLAPLYWVWLDNNGSEALQHHHQTASSIHLVPHNKLGEITDCNSNKAHKYRWHTEIDGERKRVCTACNTTTGCISECRMINSSSSQLRSFFNRHVKLVPSMSLDRTIITHNNEQNAKWYFTDKKMQVQNNFNNIFIRIRAAQGDSQVLSEVNGVT